MIVVGIFHELTEKKTKNLSKLYVHGNNVPSWPLN